MYRRALGLFLLLFEASLAAGAAQIAVSGVVLDWQDRPIAGATLEILRLPGAFQEARALPRNDEPDPVATAVSDARGRFRGSVPKAGMWRLRVHARGFLSEQLDDLPLVESTELKEVHLTPATPLRVRVIDPEGRPVAGARLRAVSPMEDGLRPGTGYELWRPAPRLATTGRDGTAVMPAGGFELTAIADGFLETTLKNLDQGAVTLRLSRGCRRTLEIMNPQRRPAAGVLVQAGRWGLGLTGAAGRMEVIAPCKGEMPLHLLTPDGRRSREVLRPSSEPSAAVQFTLPLRAAKLAGRVLDAASRQPIAGALVWPADDLAAFTRSDPQGRYQVREPDLSPGRRDAQLVATADGASFAVDDLVRLGSSRTRSEAGLRPGPTLYLRPAATVVAKVTDEKGRPLEGAETRIKSNFHPFLARSDAQGTLRLKLAGARDPAELLTTHPDFLPARSWLGSLAIRGDRPVKVVLRRGARASATIVSQDGQPVAGAQGILSPWPWPDAEDTDRKLQALSDGRGLLAFTGVLPGKYNLLVRAEGRAPPCVPGVAVRDSGEAQNLGVFRLEPGGVLEGRVVDPRNRPIAAAIVSSRDPWCGPESEAWYRMEGEVVVTGADGRFSLTALRSGSQAQLSIAKPGYAGKDLGAVEVPAREPLTIVLELSSSRRVSGSIRDERGVPVREAHLTFYTEAMKEWLLGEVGMLTLPVYDPEGRFELEVGAPGAVILDVVARGFLAKKVDFEVPPEGDVENLEIVLQSAPFVVVGQVTGPGGEPIAHADISAHKTEPNGAVRSLTFQPVTDSGGRYRAEVLSEGVWSFSVIHQGYRKVSQELEVKAGENRLDFRLERGLEVEGEVVDSSGEPVPGASLSLASNDSPWAGGYATSDESGRFLIAGLEPGAYTLSVQDKGVSPDPLPVSVAGSSVRDLRIVLERERGGVLRGRILGLDPKDLAQVQISADRSSGGSASTAADFRGEYEIRGLTPGEWTVSAYASGRRRTEATVSLSADFDEAVCDLEFPPGLTLSGRLLQTGSPAAGTPFRVTVRSGSESRFAEVNQYGEFRFEALKAGTYRVDVSVSVFVLGQGVKVLGGQDVELTSDRYVEIELR
jgi:protocatechuate 3,4-dioxygenase beta subunit